MSNRIDQWSSDFSYLSTAVLQYDIYVVFIFEKVMEFHNMFVLEIPMQLHLTEDLEMKKRQPRHRSETKTLIYNNGHV